MQPDLHDWNRFITPAELRDALARQGLREGGLSGLAPGVAPPVMIRLMRQLKKGKLSHAEFGRKTAFVLTKDLRITYIGHATKAASAEEAA